MTYSELKSRDVQRWAAIRILENRADSLPRRSIERDILVSAALYLYGDRTSGRTVERWWEWRAA